MRFILNMVVLITLSLTLSNCQITKSDTESYIEKFSENKVEFEVLAKKIAENKDLANKIGYGININEIDSEIKVKLESLGIEDINLKHSECERITEVELITNWTKNATVCLNKNECDTKQSKIGYHSKTTMIEVWGLGNGWVMWIDYDFI